MPHLVRFLSSTAVIVGTLATAPAGAVTWQVGPNVDLSVFSLGGGAAAGIAGPGGRDPLIGALRPGLRVGAWSANQRHQLFVDTGFQVLSGGSTLSSTVATLNYSHAFRPGSAPYVTFGLGIANVSFAGPNRTATSLGIGIGRRERLGHGHGSFRCEARYERLFEQRDDPYGRSLDILGVRLGFDLDLN